MTQKKSPSLLRRYFSLLSAYILVKQGQEIYSRLKSLTSRYRVAFSTASANSERLLKRPSLKTSEIGISQPKIKTLIGLLSLPDGKIRVRERSRVLHFSVNKSYRKAANYLLDRSWLWGSAYDLQRNKQILLLEWFLIFKTADLQDYHMLSFLIKINQI